MDDEDALQLSDRQARTVILAAERLGFEREPDLYEGWYHHDLHEDAQWAVAYLRAHDAGALRDALVADEPIPGNDAARSITDSGRFTYHDAFRVLELACERGFTPPRSGLPLLDDAEVWHQAQASLAFLWDHHPALLSAEFGETVRLAPLPDTARDPRAHLW